MSLVVFDYTCTNLVRQDGHLAAVMSPCLHVLCAAAGIFGGFGGSLTPVRFVLPLARTVLAPEGA
jgi:hypothetical protein